MLRALRDPRRWVAPAVLSPLATSLLVAAAVAVAVGAFEHARLFHQGYRAVPTIGTLFVVGAVGSLLAILALLARRPLAFVVGSLAISVGSIVALVLTRTGDGLFGFREAGYDGVAQLTLGAEIAAVVLTLAGAVVAGGSLLGVPGDGRRSAPGTEASARTVAAVAVTVLLGGVILGVGQQSAESPAPPADEATLAEGETTDATPPEDAVGGEVVRRAREAFGERCAGCHRLADAGSSGRIGPDLDVALPNQTAEQIREAIVDPDAKIAKGYPAGRMPSFADQLSADELDELVDYLIAVTR